MKIFSALIAMCILGSSDIVFAAEPSKESERDQQQLVALSKEIQGQQAAMADNQKKIDEKTVAVAEALRLAKIYASRGGK